MRDETLTPSTLSIDRMCKTIAILILICAVSMGTAVAQGKSGNGNGGNKGNSQSVSNAGNRGVGKGGQSDLGADLDLGNQSSYASGFEGGSVGTHGDIGARYSKPVGDSTVLQFDAGVDFEQQTSSNPAGDVNGRVGLGFQF